MPSPLARLEVAAQVGASSTAKELRDALRAQLPNYEIELRAGGFRGNADVPWETFTIGMSVALTTEAVVAVVRIVGAWVRRRLSTDAKLDYVEVVLLDPNGQALKVIRVPRTTGRAD
jgi:hypothetical protein